MKPITQAEAAEWKARCLAQDKRIGEALEMLREDWVYHNKLTNEIRFDEAVYKAICEKLEHALQPLATENFPNKTLQKANRNEHDQS